MSSFSFKGIDSSSFSSLVVTDIGRRQRAMEQVDSIAVPYRDGNVHVHSGKYNSYFRNMQLSLKNKTQRAAIYKWLTGRGKLTTSDDPGGCFYASVVTGLDVVRVSRKFDTFYLTFECDPFFYLTSGDTVVEDTVSPLTLTNLGTIPAAPYIKITGSGTVELTINSVVTTFHVDTYIECDSLLSLCYKDTVNVGSRMVGEFPMLPVGEVAISWTGTVTKFEIKPRWRQL